MKKFFQTEININTFYRKIYLIIFSVISAFAFLNFFEPFGLYYDNSISEDEVFSELIIAMIIVFIILIFSQFILRELFKIKKFNVISLVFWFLFETLLVATTWFVIEISEINDKSNNFNLFVENIIVYISIMFIPYFGFISVVNIKDTIEKLKQKDSNSSIPKIKKEITLKDEKGSVKLVLKTENLLFIQSADNYLEINYLDNEVLSKFLLRNSIKKVENLLYESQIIRCHRSYMINTGRIELVKKTSSGYNITLNKLPNITIPVSKAYTSEVKKYISN